MKRVIFFVLIAALAIGVSPFVSAQDDAPEPGAAAAEYLPSADDLGDGWSALDVLSPDTLAEYSFEMSPDVFEEGAAIVLLGPNGARVIAVALIVTDSRVAIRQSWEDASGLYDVFRYQIRYDYERESELESMELPAGCVEAKRTEGEQEYFNLPSGLTLCAVDPDVVLLVWVTGDVEGLSGIEASDAVTEKMAAP